MKIINSPILSDEEKQHIIQNNENGLSYGDNDLDLSMISNIDYDENFEDNTRPNNFKYDNKSQLSHANNVKFLEGKNGKKIISKDIATQNELINIYEYVLQKSLGANINKKYGYLHHSADYKFIKNLNKANYFIQTDQKFIKTLKDNQIQIIDNIDNLINVISRVFSHNGLYEITPDIQLATDKNTGMIKNIQITYYQPYRDKKTRKRKYRKYFYSYQLSQQMIDKLSNPEDKTGTRNVFLGFLFNYYYDQMMFGLIDRKLDNMAVERGTGNINHFDIDALESTEYLKQNKAKEANKKKIEFLFNIRNTFLLTPEEAEKYDNIAKNKINKCYRLMKNLSNDLYNKGEKNILIDNLFRELYKSNIIEQLNIDDFFDYISARINNIQKQSQYIPNILDNNKIHKQGQEIISRIKYDIDNMKDKYKNIDLTTLIQQQKTQQEKQYNQASVLTLIMNDPTEATDALSNSINDKVKKISNVEIIIPNNPTSQQQKCINIIQQAKQNFINVLKNKSANKMIELCNSMEQLYRKLIQLKKEQQEMINAKTNDNLSTIKTTDNIEQAIDRIEQDINEVQNKIDKNKALAKKYAIKLAQDYCEIDNNYNLILKNKKVIEQIEIEKQNKAKQNKFKKRNKKSFSKQSLYSNKNNKRTIKKNSPQATLYNNKRELPSEVDFIPIY